MKKKALFSWSGGKDSAFALYEILKDKKYEIASLLTTVNEAYQRSSMHGIRRVLLEEQARALGFPLEEVFISKNSSSEEYETKMRETLGKYLASGVSSVIFGDVFLEDVRKYREDKLSKVGMEAVFPIWKRDTGRLARSFIKLGFKAVTTCVDTKFLGKGFVGRDFDEQFLRELPPAVDPAGENGEFHSFVYAGPLFRNEVAFTKGEVVLRDKRFYYCDLY